MNRIPTLWLSCASSEIGDTHLAGQLGYLYGMAIANPTWEHIADALHRMKKGFE